MQIESVLASTRIVSSHQEPTSVPVLSPSCEDKLLDLMTKLFDRIEFISLQQQSPRFTLKPRPPHRVPAPRAPRKPVICFRCNQEGHFTRGCAAPRQYKQGNNQPPTE